MPAHVAMEAERKLEAQARKRKLDDLLDAAPGSSDPQLAEHARKRMKNDLSTAARLQRGRLASAPSVGGLAFVALEC